jgi:hypothetical protein
MRLTEMIVLNYEQRGFKKLISRGVPLHAVDFPCNPLGVGGVRTRLRESADGQNMIQRVVQAKHNQLASVGAAIVLVFQLLADNLSVLCSFQTISRGFLKVAWLAKTIFFIRHRWERLHFTAHGTVAISSAFISTSFNAGRVLFTTWLTVNAPYAVRILAANSAKSLFSQVVITLQHCASVGGLALWCFLVSTYRFPVSGTAKMFYNNFSHWTHDLRSWVNWLDPLKSYQLFGGLTTFYHLNACKCKQNGGLS